MNRWRIVAAACAVALAAVGCGSGDGDASATGGKDREAGSTAPGGSAGSTTGTDADGTGADDPDDDPEDGYDSAITDEEVDGKAFNGIERRVVDRIRRAGLPGASLLVVHRGELVQQEAWLDYELDTVVSIASGSKWLTAATVMSLVDEGLIGLDEPISTYLPDVPASSEVGAITMRQLLSFTSGLVADERVPCIDAGTGTLRECAAEILGQGVVHPPGTAFRYGSQHMHVAAAVAEEVSGVPFAELFQERIAEPLGMTSTSFPQIGGGRDDVTHPLPAGGARSTLGDYGRFLEMVFHDGVAPSGERILDAETVAEMRVNHTEDVKYASASSFRMSTKGPYGLGQWIDWTDEDGEALVLSSDGKFGFRPWIDHRNELFGVYLVEDKGSGYVEGDPDAPANDAGKIHTSGLFIFEWVAEAVGGSLPEEEYPHRGGG